MHHVFMYFLGRLLLSAQAKIIMFSEKIPSFQVVQERPCAGVALFGRPIISEGLKKISDFRVFFKKDHLSFSVWRERSYFRQKEMSSFPIIQERSYSGAIFLERPSFQDVRKKKIWFSVQCFVWLSTGEKKMAPNQLFFDWCIWSWLISFSVKILITFFYFCKIQVLGPASRNLWWHQHGHISCCNPWKKFFDSDSRFALQLKKF